MKIIFIANSEKMGGGNKSLISICRSLGERGHIPIVFVPAEGRLSIELKKSKIRYHIIQTRFYDKPTVHIAWIFAKVILLLLKEKPNLIHANDVYCYKYYSLAAKLLNIPILCHFRHFIEGGIAEYLLDIPPTLSVFNSKYNLERTLSLNPTLFNKSSAMVLYNFFHEVEYYPYTNDLSFRKLFNIACDTYLILVIGNINPGKGHLDLVSALEKLKQQDFFIRNPKVQFVIAGEDVTNSGIESEMRAKIKKANLSQYIMFTGFVSDTKAAYAAANTVLIPSIEEPFGRVAVEAVLARKPVIARNNSGLNEILSLLKAPVLTIDDSIDSLASAIERGVTHEIDDSALEQDAQSVSLRFSEENQFNRLVNSAYLPHAR
jgi:glycosyltransferase involved in cell wall biosynthesis